ncbi:MAG: sulfotransferase family protein [Methylacidiphilales bacterium]|nr:sulfotransferase family protein [Candidatus Methylacidiphilales bacterium]
MAFLLKNGAVFFHIPKTGGTWVLGILKEFDLIQAQLGHGHSHFERALGHDRFHRDFKVFRHILNRAVRSPWAKARMEPGCFKFCFIREPLRWYESYWRFRQSQDWIPKHWPDESDPYNWNPCAMVNGLGSSDFNTFMHNVNKKRPGFVTEMYGWYVQPDTSFIGKIEYLRQDLIKAFSLMKLEVDVSRILSMPMQNETPSHIPMPEWDPKLRKETLELEYAGYVRFGYDWRYSVCD